MSSAPFFWACQQKLAPCRFTKALFRKALALEGMQQLRPALEAMLQAQEQEPKDTQASGICQGPVHAASLEPLMHAIMFLSSLIHMWL